MVISRSDAKKRRKEGDSLEDSLQGSPKRTKVHAQRKFAQGSSNVSSPALTPVKDKDKVKTNGTVLSPELIPSKRPKTEDFLTFLCFRGTPILPPQLDFFNVATIQDNQDDEQCSSAGDCTTTRPVSVVISNQKPQKPLGSDQPTTSGIARRSDRIENEAKKKPTTAVQALRKKYQEQRLAKQRASTLSKLAQKVKGKNMVRTRSSALREDSRPASIQHYQSKAQAIKKPTGDIEIPKSAKPVRCMSLRRLTTRGPSKVLQDTENSAVRRGGLRSSGQLPPGSHEGLKSERALHHKLTAKERLDKAKTKVFVSSLSDFSSDDDQPLVKKTRPLEQTKQSNRQQLARKMVKRIVKSSRKLHPHMVTRSKQQQYKHQHQTYQAQRRQQQPQTHPQQPVQSQQQPLQQPSQQQPQQQQNQLAQVVTRLSSRPTRKTKEAATLYMELLGKKLISTDVDADEDTLSVDSFPELPNSKRNEQRELEIKTRHAKEKREAQMQKKESQLGKKDMIVHKKEVQMKKDNQSQKRETSIRKEEVKTRNDISGKLKSERSKEMEETKGVQKLKDERSKSTAGKAKLLDNKEGALSDSNTTNETKVVKNQKRTSKDSQEGANEKAKIKQEPSTKFKGKDQALNDLSNSKSKNQPLLSHKLRSRRSIAAQFKECEHDYMEQDETHSSGPRRSLRRGSRDTSAPLSDATESASSEVTCVRSRKIQSASISSFRRQSLKSYKVNAESLEDKFSDSDEEPLGKIVLKQNICKKNDIKDDKKIEEGGITKKTSAKESSDGIHVPQVQSKDKNKAVMKVTRASGSLANECSVEMKGRAMSGLTNKVVTNKAMKSVKCIQNNEKQSKVNNKSENELKEETLVVNKTRDNKKKSLDQRFISSSKEDMCENDKKKVHAETLTCREESIASETSNSEAASVNKLKYLGRRTRERKSGEDRIKTQEVAKCSPDSKRKSRDDNPGEIHDETVQLKISKLKESEILENSVSFENLDVSGPQDHVISSEKDKKNKKCNSPRGEGSDTPPKSLSSKGRGEESEQRDIPSVHVHPMRKCLVGIESEFRKHSHINCVQRRGGTFTRKELKGDTQRRSSASCPKETELELQRRLSMVCLKEPESEADVSNTPKSTVRLNQNFPEGGRRTLRLLDKDVRVHLSHTKSDSVNFCSKEISGSESSPEIATFQKEKELGNWDSNVVQRHDKRAELKDKCGELHRNNFTYSGRLMDGRKDLSSNLDCHLENLKSKLVTPGESNAISDNLTEKDTSQIKQSVGALRNCPAGKSTGRNKSESLVSNLFGLTRERNILGIVSPQKSEVNQKHISNTQTCDSLYAKNMYNLNCTTQVTEDALHKKLESGVLSKSDSRLTKDGPERQSLDSESPAASDTLGSPRLAVLGSEMYAQKQTGHVILEESENRPIKLNVPELEVEKRPDILSPVLPGGLALRDLKAKEKLNMSAERVEKWLSESCSGNIEHKKDCTIFDRNVCNCGLAVIDDDLCLSEYSNEKLISERISAGCVVEERNLKLATIMYSSYVNDTTELHNYKLDSASALSNRNNNFQQKEFDKSDLQENTADNEQNMLDSAHISKPSGDSVNNQKVSDSSFVHCSYNEEPTSGSLHETSQKTVALESSESPPIQKSLATRKTAVRVTSEHSSASIVKDGTLTNMQLTSTGESDGEKNSGTSPTASAVQSQEQSRHETVKSRSSGDTTPREKPSPSGDNDIKKTREGSKLDLPFSSRTGTRFQHFPERMGEKKSIFHQRRPFPHKVKERKDLTPSANAFSPENESSVYAFETEPELPPISTPFRRRARDSRTSSTTTSKSEEDLLKLAEEEVSPIANTNPLPVPPALFTEKVVTSCGTGTNTPIRHTQVPVSIQTLSPQVTTNRSSTSIAVQVNLDSEVGSDTSPQYLTVADTIVPEPVMQRSMECSTQTEVTEEDDDESEGHLFYIPLQQAPTPAQQLIQGVAVKLGTEGPTGPNQRVIMRAKLVTKPPNFNRANISTQEGSLGIRRTVLGSQHPRPSGMLMMEQKSSFMSSGGTSSSSSCGTYPPVGTVQPTARSRPNPLVSHHKSDATTATVGNSGVNDSPTKGSGVSSEASKFATNSTEKDTGTAAVSKSVPVSGTQGALMKDRKSVDTNIPTPSTSSNVGSTPTKTAFNKAGAKERRSSGDQVSPNSSKGGAVGAKRGMPKGKIAKGSEGFYNCTPSNISTFPSLASPAQLVEAPSFHPTEKEFQDPLEFIDKIRPVAEKFGLCRVVPPSNFRPECKVSDDMRFTAYNQYVHKMLHRWGPNVKEMMAIKKYLATQSIPFTHPPWIGGMEVDLPRLYQTVQSFGGLKEVIEKKRWQRVADGMKIPKSAQDRVTKLDDIYCKYLLPYDTLSPDERQKLLDEVEEEWQQRQNRPLSQESSSSSDSHEDESDADIADEECIVKGRNMPLNAFYRIARNTMAMWFRQPEPSASEVEQEFWKHVMSRNSHVCVHSGSIDSSGWGYGFPCSKNSPFARHPWNLKVLTNNSGSVLRSIGPIMGVTVPTLHVGMLFTTCCWYRDPHGLPWIEYLHTGASKVWYGIPDSYSSVFQSAMNKLVPRYCKNKTIWLPSDTAMVPPSLLVKHGVSLCHTVQEPGQFIVVFPRAFTSSICTGYLVSESVYFAQPSWLPRAEEVFKDIQDSCEPSMFSLERLLFSIASDARSHVDVLRQVLPMILSIRHRELENRKQLYGLGLKTSERLPLPEASVKRRKIRAAHDEEGDYECEICRANLFVSLVTNSHEEGVYCLPHAIELLTKKRNHLKYCKLIYTYDQAELNELIQKLQDKIETKSQKKSQGKHSASAQK